MYILGTLHVKIHPEPVQGYVATGAINDVCWRLMHIFNLFIEEPFMTERNGSCLCGAVTYRITSEPVMARICWCRTCQHLSANGTVNIIVPTDALSAVGVTSEYVSIADSGNEVKRRFCPQCGSHLFANSSARPQFTVVRAGTLSDPSSIKPNANIWAASAPQWACMDPTLERFEQQPAPPAARA